MKNLTSYVFDFEKLLQDDCLYVDKTEYIWNLIPTGIFLDLPNKEVSNTFSACIPNSYTGKIQMRYQYDLYY
ncbi:MAG: hypothetical protein IKB16_08020 [Lentisphaeria bacterium]|nr:hypothetical protein [Lentisphaeria bacterium]